MNTVVLSLIILVSCKHHNEKPEAKSSQDFLKGEYYDYFQRQDSAFYFYNRVVQNSVDSLEKATAYFKMGLWNLAAGDYYSAQESLLSSIKTLDPKDSAHHQYLSAAYNSLANATLNLTEYESAIENYYVALNFVPDEVSRLHILNNIGLAYQKEKAFSKATIVFDSAIATNVTDTSLKAKLITNSGVTKWLADSSYDAIPELMKGLKLRMSINDSLGLNSSFAHLSEYYTSSQPDSALYYATERLKIAQTLNDPNDRLEALDQLIKVGRPERTNLYAEQYIQLDDSLDKIHSRDRNQFALIRFGAEKAKADKLSLEKDVIKQRLFSVITVAVALVLITVFLYRAKIRRKRLRIENEKAMGEAQLKTSQKVHDVVANGLYRIMNELEHLDEIRREELLDKIEALYEKSRDISYETSVNEIPGYDKHLHQLIDSFSSDKTHIVVIGNENIFWDKLNGLQKNELKMVIEELLINMQKHSKAKQVVFHFKVRNNKVHVVYRDDGIGLGPAPRFGNGLHSTVNRIKSIGGEINFSESRGEGASISVSFPLKVF